MKKLILAAAVVLMGHVLLAQTTRNLSSFTKVHAQEGIDVILKAGSKESARIQADNIDVDDVRTDVDGNVLRIHLEGDNHRNIDVKVYVTYVQLSGIKASSAASIVFENKVEAKGDFDISCSSAGKIEIDLKADDVNLDISSAGDVEAVISASNVEAEVSSAGELELSGQANGIDASVSSSGEIEGYDFTAKNGDLRASSGGSIEITITENLEGRASSGGSIRYKGAPKNVDSDSSSGGSVRRY